MTDLLKVDNLKVQFHVWERIYQAVDDISFTIPSGKSLALVGESGCGKTVTALSVMRLLPRPQAKMISGTIYYNGINLIDMSMKHFQKQLRGKEIGMFFQDPHSVLNPVLSIKAQISEHVKYHLQIKNNEIMEKALGIFRQVNLRDGEEILNKYPHQLSGGQIQRLMIAMTLMTDPALIIADEPTTALDVVVQDRILHRILKIQKEINSSMIFITHDISVVSEICDYILVMYGGTVMELAHTDSFFRHPYHPYSLGLQNAFPSITEIVEELISIPGSPPNLLVPPQGCRFHERCPFAQEQCRNEQPALMEAEPGHYAACHFLDKAEEFRLRASKGETWETVRQRILAEKTKEGTA